MEPQTGTRELLSRGLAEVQALAEGAYWSAGKAYAAWRGVVLTSGCWLALLVYLALRPAESDPSLWARKFFALAISLGLAAAAAVPPLTRLRRRFVPAMTLAIDWGRRLWYARNPPPDGPRPEDPRSSFELLVDASAHISTWLSLVRARGRLVGAGIAFIVCSVSLPALYFAFGWVIGFPGFWPLGLLFAALVALGIPGYFLEARRWERDFHRLLSEWGPRYAEIRARMVEYVEGL